MKATKEVCRGPEAPGKKPSIIPLWLKLLYTLFMAILVPVYWRSYGPTNFLYFCDTALFLVWLALWTETSLPASMAAVGLLIPQFFWCVDFVAELFGARITGLTGYMFDPQRSVFLRCLSLFHGWLPFLLVYALLKLGYDPRALWSWTALGWSLCLTGFFLPPAGAQPANPMTPINVNLVYGFNDTHAQTWMPPILYLALWMAALFLLAYLPTHVVLKKTLLKPFTPGPPGSPRVATTTLPDCTMPDNRL